MEYSRGFITSVIVGKDIVPRIGLHQLEALRHDLIHALHKSKDPKVGTIENNWGKISSQQKLSSRRSVGQVQAYRERGGKVGE